ncbi:MAG: prepilin peptidase [Alphaproteobacteria bacterium]|nr:prepilin peptidase [Alphaproteobacteria bacterium]
MMFGLDVWALASLSVLAVGLIALAVIDFRTGYLPDWIQLVLAVAGLGVVLIGSPVKLTWPMALLGATINMAVFYGLRWIVSRIKNREAMGLGDVKLVGVGGLWLGPLALPYIMAVGGIATLLGALVAGVITGKPVWQGEMPLGPGLALGILGTYIAALAGVSLLPGAV